jgi:hypothetical protein
LLDFVTKNAFFLFRYIFNIFCSPGSRNIVHFLLIRFFNNLLGLK